MKHCNIRKVLALVTICFAGIASPLFSETPTEPGSVIERGSSDADWRWLISALAAKGNTFSTFTENRYFTARKDPVVFTGEMRLIPERGLSLHYITPEETLTIIDTQGLFLRDAKGRTRQIKAGTRDAGLVAALLPVMRFDEENLFKNFIIHAARNGDDWRFDFVPLNERLAAALGSIIVTGSGTEIKKISFHASPKLRIEVLIGETKSGVTFSDDDMQTYFR